MVLLLVSLRWVTLRIVLAIEDRAFSLDTILSWIKLSRAEGEREGDGEGWGE